MALTSSAIVATNTLEQFRLEFNKLRVDVTALDTADTYVTNIVFEGATTDSYQTTLAVTDPTADRTITLPNLTGTLSLLDATETISPDISCPKTVFFLTLLLLFLIILRSLPQIPQL